MRDKLETETLDNGASILVCDKPFKTFSLVDDETSRKRYGLLLTKEIIEAINKMKDDANF